MKRVVATGTFDILHPGHIYYLEQSKKLGDELYVIIARDANVKHKPQPIIPEEQRRRMVAALRCVDHAILGDKSDMFRPIEEIHPEIITIGFNQHFDESKLQELLAARGLSARIVRIGKYGDDELCSSRLVVQRIVEKRGS
ncbi:MAG: FAD synthase [Methanoregula sp.]|nr:MAG: FAD synthase [Methanoregula sp.]